MPKSLPPALRRQIIAYNPSDPDAPSVSAFCRKLGISRPSFYTVRDRHAHEGNAALHPRSRAPHRSATVYAENTRTVVLKVRKQLKSKGRDAGPKSIWHLMVDEDLCAGAIPSVSTIARILKTAGVVDPNPRKRPQTSYLRFQRAAAMELWQLDAFEYVLFNPDPDTARDTVTVYQLVDDSTRFDAGTCAFAVNENGEDAVTAVTAAINVYGVPQELLSDNGSAFNLIRLGRITGLQRELARLGCKAITGHFASPTTQGKNERSHQTVQRFLDAHAPTTLAQVHALLVEYREYYNHRRHHQSLPNEITPGQAWDTAEHRCPTGEPITDEELDARALEYRDRAAAAAMAPRIGAIGPGVLGDSATTVVIDRQNRQFYWHGRILRVPTYLVGRYVLVLTESRYTLFDTVTGIEAISFPLPLETATTSRLVMLWRVRGAVIRDAPTRWTQQHEAYEAEHFPAVTSVESLSTKS